MEVGRSISKAIAERLGGDMDSAMLHASNAVDGTAKKVYPTLGVGARFTKLLRESYANILEPMMPGINTAGRVRPGIGQVAGQHQPGVVAVLAAHHPDPGRAVDLGCDRQLWVVGV